MIPVPSEQALIELVNHHHPSKGADPRVIALQLLQSHEYVPKPPITSPEFDIYEIERHHEDNMIKALKYGILAANIKVQDHSLTLLEGEDEDGLRVYKCERLLPKGSTITYDILIVGASLKPAREFKKSSWIIKHTHGNRLGGDESGFMKIRMGVELKGADSCFIADSVYFISADKNIVYKH